jgi:hypothetical protein
LAYNSSYYLCKNLSFILIWLSSIIYYLGYYFLIL